MISLFKELMGQAQSSLKPHLNYKEIKAAIDERIKGRQNFDEELPFIDVDDFIKRYRNVRFSAITAGVLGLISLVTVACASTGQDFVFSLLSFLVLELFYVKLNFLLWASRETAFSEQSKIVRLPDYLTAITKDPNQFLPLSLAHKLGKK